MATGQNIVLGGSPSGRVTIPALFKPQFLRVTTGTNHSDAPFARRIVADESDEHQPLSP
jgi:hypothetical protein